MKLNTIAPAEGAKKKAVRVGRGIGSGLGKTCGSGHKGQNARKSGGVKPGFEGGQMPLHRRMPKSGFRSRKALVHEEIRTSELNVLDSIVSLETLRDARIINASIKTAKIVLSGDVTKPLTVQGLPLTKGARAAIEAAGGKVVE